jgi:hypothetical protein
MSRFTHRVRSMYEYGVITPVLRPEVRIERLCVKTSIDRLQGFVWSAKKAKKYRNLGHNQYWKTASPPKITQSVNYGYPVRVPTQHPTQQPTCLFCTVHTVRTYVHEGSVRISDDGAVMIIQTRRTILPSTLFQSTMMCMNLHDVLRTASEQYG